MNGMYLTYDEAEEYRKKYYELNPADDPDEAEDVFWMELYGAVIMNDAGSEGWFSGYMETTDDSVELHEGDVVVPIEFQGTWIDYLAGKANFLTLDEIIHECRNTYGKYLPETFPYEKHIGVFSGCFYG